MALKITHPIMKTWQDRNGYSKIIPAQYGNKHCSIKGHPEIEQDQLWRQAPDATGAQIILDDICIVDIDTQLEKVTVDTYAVKSLRGIHLYFRVPEGQTVQSADSTTISGVEIKGHGSKITVAGSFVNNCCYAELNDWSTLRSLTAHDIEHWGITMGQARGFL